MVQVLATIFFSAVALGAFSVIAAMMADNRLDILRALGLDVAVAPPARQIRTRRAPPASPTVKPVQPLRAAA